MTFDSKYAEPFRRQVDAWMEVLDLLPEDLMALHGKRYNRSLTHKVREQYELPLVSVRKYQETALEVSSGKRVPIGDSWCEYGNFEAGQVYVVPKGAIMYPCKPEEIGGKRTVASAFVPNVVYDGMRLAQLRITAASRACKIAAARYSSNGRCAVTRTAEGLYLVS